MGQIIGMGEDDQIAYFIEGLKPSTKMEVSYRSPGTFEETWEMAVKYDTAMFGTTCPSSSYQSPAGKPYNKPIPMELDQAEYRKKPHSSSSIKKKITCYNCEKIGHIAKECRSKPKAKVASIEEPIQEVELTHIEENKEQLLRFNGRINGHPAWILLDSGASRNFVDENFV